MHIVVRTAMVAGNTLHLQFVPAKAEKRYNHLHGLAGLATAKCKSMAGVAGFEPANAGTKNRCLTTWRHPSDRHVAWRRAAL
jgi:hypothetical protein